MTVSGIDHVGIAALDVTKVCLMRFDFVIADTILGNNCPKPETKGINHRRPHTA